MLHDQHLCAEADARSEEVVQAEADGELELAEARLVGGPGVLPADDRVIGAQIVA